MSSDLSGGTNTQSVAMTAVRSVTANFTALSGVTVTTSPPGLSIVVDGNTLTAPQNFQWAPNSVHTIGVTSPQATGAGGRGVYQAWSDAGAQSHSITVPSSSITYTANFTQQYLLTAAASPSSVGTVTASPASGDGYFIPGTSVQLTAAVGPAYPNYQFNGWTGDLSGTQNPQSILMSAARNVTANFWHSPINISSVPSGLSVLVDGNAITTPQTISWMQGSSHTLDADFAAGDQSTLRLRLLERRRGAIAYRDCRRVRGQLHGHLQHSVPAYPIGRSGGGWDGYRQPHLTRRLLQQRNLGAVDCLRQHRLSVHRLERRPSAAAPIRRRST